MIEITLTDCQWGTYKPDTGGLQINVRDGDDGIIFHIPFDGEALKQLALDVIDSLSDDQKPEVTTRLLSVNHQVSDESGPPS